MANLTDDVVPLDARDDDDDDVDATKSANDGDAAMLANSGADKEDGTDDKIANNDGASMGGTHRTMRVRIDEHHNSIRSTTDCSATRCVRPDEHRQCDSIQ